MAIPAHRNTGTIAQAGTGSVTPSMPTHAADDILVLYVSGDFSADTITVSGGSLTWTLKTDSSTGATNTDVWLKVYWARATSGSETAPTVAGSNNVVQAQISSFSGAITSGDPFDVTTTRDDTGSGTTVTWDAVTTTVADCLILLPVGFADDTGSDPGTSYSNGNLSSITERADTGTALGNDNRLTLVDGGKASAGDTGATTATIATGTVKRSTHTLALKPPAAGGGTTHPGWTTPLGGWW